MRSSQGHYPCLISLSALGCISRPFPPQIPTAKTIRPLLSSGFIAQMTSARHHPIKFQVSHPSVSYTALSVRLAVKRRRYTVLLTQCDVTQSLRGLYNHAVTVTRLNIRCNGQPRILMLYTDITYQCFRPSHFST